MRKLIVLGIVGLVLATPASAAKDPIYGAYGKPSSTNMAVKQGYEYYCENWLYLSKAKPRVVVQEIIRCRVVGKVLHHSVKPKGPKS